MRHFILYISILFFSCTPHKTNEIKLNPEEYLESVTLNPIVYPGIGLGELRLEETRGQDLFNERINGRAYLDLNIQLQYRRGDTLTGITIYGNGRFQTADGKKIGVTEEEIINVFGKPISKGTSIKKGNHEIGPLPTLNYHGMSVWFNNENERTIFIWKD